MYFSLFDSPILIRIESFLEGENIRLDSSEKPLMVQLYLYSG